jgi:excisionase family DNA binding protein
MRELIEEPAAKPAIPDDLHAFTVPQTGELLGLSDVFLRVMRKRREIRSVKAGRPVLVPATAIREFLAPRAPAPDVEYLAPATTAS